MDIVLTFDDGYCPYACATIASVLRTNKCKHVFHIITDGIGGASQKKITDYLKFRGNDVKFYVLDREILKSFPIGKGMANTYVSLATYYRLFIPEVLSTSIEKVLYLDCDVIVNGDLCDLWNYSFANDDECIYALEEFPDLAFPGCRRLNYPFEYSYFNAGVLLINLTNLRKHYSIDKAIDYIRTHNIKYHDQDVLNGMLYENKIFMPLKYNIMDAALIKNAKFPKRYENQEEALTNPVIVHFSGPIKPWHKECKNPYAALYWENVGLTPWKDIVVGEKHTGFLDKLLYKVKCFIKYSLEFFHIKYYSFVRL